MDVIRKIADLDPRDISTVERLFGQDIHAKDDVVLILRTKAADSVETTDGDAQLPPWCNVLDGLEESDLLELDEILQTPVRVNLHTD